MTTTRIDMITVTEDLDKSIDFYRDTIGLEMRAFSNPVLIFKYDFISFYVYLDKFFEEQFRISTNEITGNGMLSIEIKSIEELNALTEKLKNDNKFDLKVLRTEKYSTTIRDFNGLVIELWVNFQKLS